MQPWIVCGKRKSFHGLSSPTETSRAGRKDALEAAGAEIIEADLDKKQAVDLQSALSVLKQLGINSLMVEGGAAVIAAFLNLRGNNGEALVDMHVVTVAPTIIGPTGVQAASLIQQIPTLYPVAAEVLGKDAVFASQLRAL